jgi:sec-independent protein translocase protein TatA
MFGLGPIELIVIGAIAVMLYGKRLPEVGRSVGQGIGELRRQWATLSRDLDVSSHLNGVEPAPKRRTRRLDDEGSSGSQVAAPRFDPPPESD